MAIVRKSKMDAIDIDVANLVKRIGSLDKPENAISNYTIDRDHDGLKRVTITVYADGQFGELIVSTDLED